MSPDYVEEAEKVPEESWHCIQVDGVQCYKLHCHTFQETELSYWYLCHSEETIISNLGT